MLNWFYDIYTQLKRSSHVTDAGRTPDGHGLAGECLYSDKARSLEWGGGLEGRLLSWLLHKRLHQVDGQGEYDG